MPLTSRLCFGFIFIFSAACALSAPSFYQDELDEKDRAKEAVLERLAEMIAANRGQRIDYLPLEYQKQYLREQQIEPEYEMEDYLIGLGLRGQSKFPAQDQQQQQQQQPQERTLEEELDSLPKKFAYTPDDVRFYLPKEAFPTTTAEIGQSKTESGDNLKSDDKLPEAPAAGIPARPAVVVPAVHDSITLDAPPMKKPGPGGIGLMDSYLNQQFEEGHQQFDPLPNHAMANSHFADQPNIYIGERAPSPLRDFYFIAIVAGCTAVILVGLVAAGVCAYRLRERIKSTESVDYGVTGPSKDVSPSIGDRKLAHSAHMYHYQHQKQQMAALQKTNLTAERAGGSDVESEDENDDELDYTVYECPGLAPAGEMEVKNPLFHDDQTPSTPYGGDGEKPSAPPAAAPSPSPAKDSTEVVKEKEQQPAKKKRSTKK